MSETLSFVSVSRNDGYGGNLLGRMHNHVRSIAAAAADIDLPVEIVLVEWNPPSDSEALETAIDWPSLPANVEIKLITVPSEFHHEREGADKQPVFEYVGKNVGIRRCEDGPVVITNPDIIFSEALVTEMYNIVQPDSFYRIDRHDVETVPPQTISAEQLGEFCLENTHVVRTDMYRAKPGPVAQNRHIRQLRYLESRIVTEAKKIVDRYTNLYPVQESPNLFFNFAGDFILTSRENLTEVRGFPETDFNWGVDDLMVLNLASYGLKQETLGGSHRIFHQEHENMHGDRPQRNIGDLIDTRTDGGPFVYQPNENDWGLANHDLPQTTLDTQSLNR